MIGCGNTSPFPLTPRPNSFRMGDDERIEMFKSWDKSDNRASEIRKKISKAE